MSLELERPPPEEPGFDEYRQYRTLSSLAVVSCALGVLSFLALLDWSLGLIPILGTVTGLLALKRIRARASEFGGEGLALAGTMLSILLLGVGWTRLGYVYATEVPEGYQRISYDDLQPDESIPGQTIPPSAMDLDGKKVFIKGYVYQPPSGQMKGIKRFVLVRDKGECCFGGNPRLTDMILVDLAGTLEAKFDMRMRRLGGKFRVAVGLGVDGLGGVIYHLEADHLE